MAIKYEVMAGAGTYGDGKTRWLRCGVVFEKDGKLSLKLESVPIGKDFDGWFQLFVPKVKDGAAPAAKPAAAPATKPEPQEDFDVPF